MAPRAANPETRERLLAAAERLMLAKGFGATAVEDVCRGAGLTKGSFFHYFASKEVLGRAVVNRYAEHRLAAMRSATRRRADPRARLYALVDLFIARARDPILPRGCLLGTLGQELAHSHPGVRAEVARRFTIWADDLETELRAAKAQHAPHASWGPRSVARHFIATFEGALLVARAHDDFGAFEDSMKHFRAYLVSLLGAPRRARR